jgi:hypothetical protein
MNDAGLAVSMQVVSALPGVPCQASVFQSKLICKHHAGLAGSSNVAQLNN